MCTGLPGGGAEVALGQPAVDERWAKTGFPYTIAPVVHGAPPSASHWRATSVPIPRFAEVQEPILEQVCSLHARTLEGILARARTIVLQDAELDPDADALEGYTNNRLVAALLRDLLAMEGAADA